MPRTRSTLARSRDPADSQFESGMRGRLHTLRRGLSLSSLTAITGYSNESVSRYLKQDTPSFLFLARLCFALDVSLDWLIFNRGEPRPTHAAPSPHSVVEGQLADLQLHLNMLNLELDGEDAAPSKHVVRFLLGPADGQRLAVTGSPRDSLHVLIDPVSREASMAADSAAHDDPNVHVYQRVLTNVYSWVNPPRDM